MPVIIFSLNIMIIFCPLCALLIFPFGSLFSVPFPFVTRAGPRGGTRSGAGGPFLTVMSFFDQDLGTSFPPSLGSAPFLRIFRQMQFPVQFIFFFPLFFKVFSLPLSAQMPVFSPTFLVPEGGSPYRKILSSLARPPFFEGQVFVFFSFRVSAYRLRTLFILPFLLYCSSPQTALLLSSPRQVVPLFPLDENLEAWSTVSFSRNIAFPFFASLF